MGCARELENQGITGKADAGNGGPSLALDVSALGPALTRLPSGSKAARNSKVIKVLAARTLGAVGGLRAYILFPGLVHRPYRLCHLSPWPFSAWTVSSSPRPKMTLSTGSRRSWIASCCRSSYPSTGNLGELGGGFNAKKVGSLPHPPGAEPR